MEHDYHQFRRRLRENEIKWNEEAEAELKRITRIVETLDETDGDGRLTAAANQSRQARNNPFLQTTARPQARRRCEQQLKKAEHEATLAYQHLCMCLEKVRFQEELLSAFSEEPIKAVVATNKPDCKTLAAPLTQEEVCSQGNVEPETESFQRAGKHELDPYITTIVNAPSPILGPTHDFMQLHLDGRTPKLSEIKAGFSTIELQKLVEFENKLEAGLPFDGCDRFLVIRALTHEAIFRLKMISFSCEDSRDFAFESNRYNAAKHLARWWAFTEFYASDRHKSEFWPVGFFHDIEGPDFSLSGNEREGRSHVKIKDPRL